MKTSAALLALLLLGTSLPAQNFYRATQQARRDSAMNDAEQRRIANEANGAQPANAAPGASGQPAAQPMDPALQATLKNIAGLQSDFTALSTAVAPDAGQKTSLLNNLSQAATGKKASSASIKQLATDLSTALASNKSLTAAQQKQLAGFVHAAFNGSHLNAAQSEKIFASLQKLLTDGGVSLNAATDIVTDLKKIADETK
jgi:hypothetical protein